MPTFAPADIDTDQQQQQPPPQQPPAASAKAGQFSLSDIDAAPAQKVASQPQGKFSLSDIDAPRATATAATASRPDLADSDEERDVEGVQAPPQSVAPTSYGRDTQGRLSSKWDGQKWVGLYDGKPAPTPASQETAAPPLPPGAVVGSNPDYPNRVSYPVRPTEPMSIMSEEPPPAPRGAPMTVYSRVPGTQVYQGPPGTRPVSTAPTVETIPGTAKLTKELTNAGIGLTPVGAVASGADQLAQGIGDLAQFAARGLSARAGVQQEGPAPTGKDIAAAGVKVLKGSAEIGSVLVPFAAVQAPIETVATLAGYELAQQGTERGLEAIGTPKEYSQLAGQLAGFGAGWGVGKAAGLFKPGAIFGQPIPIESLTDQQVMYGYLAAREAGNQPSMEVFGREGMRRQAGTSLATTAPSGTTGAPPASGQPTGRFSFADVEPFGDSGDWGAFGRGVPPTEANAGTPQPGGLDMVRAAEARNRPAAAGANIPPVPTEGGGDTTALARLNQPEATGPAPASAPSVADLLKLKDQANSHADTQLGHEVDDALQQALPSVNFRRVVFKGDGYYVRPDAQEKVEGGPFPNQGAAIQALIDESHGTPTGPVVEHATGQQPSTPSAPQQGEPGWVGNIPTSTIKADPVRFQFKRDVGQGGAGEELKEVSVWDPEKAGITAVWRDPEDGQTYVVNGHHRLDLANRLDVPDMTVRYIDAADAQEARLKGALINVAEGRGDSIDAAKVFRDGELTPEDLRAQGVSLKGKVAGEGMALANLSRPIFDDVVSGQLSPARGAVIGAGLPNPADQESLYDLIQQREKSGKRLTNDQVGELIRLATEAPRQTETTADLFGEQEMTRSLLPEKAEVSDYVRKQLATERRLFGAVSSQAAAQRLGETGNVIKAGENAQVAQRANQGMMLYDKLSAGAGTIGTHLDRAAQSLADGENANEVKQRAYRQIRSEIVSQVARLTGSPGAAGGGTEGLDRPGTLPGQPVRGDEGQPGVLAARRPTTPPSGSLFGGDAEDESRAAAQLHQDRLLHDQLTAQIQSGGAVKPSNLKPAESGDLFNQGGPEQGSLFARRLRTDAAMFARVPEVSPGGRGGWVVDGKWIDNGTSLHAQMFEHAHPGTLFGDVVRKQIDSGAVRVRGENIELAQAALSSRNLEPAVEHAVMEADRKRAGAINVEVHQPNGRTQFLRVPMREVPEFLASPARYAYQNRDFAAAYARRTEPDARQMSLFDERATTLDKLAGAAPHAMRAAVQVDPTAIKRLSEPAAIENPNSPTVGEIHDYWNSTGVRVGKLGGRPALFVNEPGMEVVLRRMSQFAGGHSAENTIGVTLAPGEVKNILAEARAAAASPRPGGFDDALQRVAAQIRKAIGGAENASTPLPVVQAGKGIPDDVLKRTAEEELDHAAQMDLPAGLQGLPAEMVESQAGQKAAAALARSGYPTLRPESPFYQHNRALIAAEIGVRLMRPGRWQELDLTAQEARDMAADYIIGLERQNGSAARAIVDQIYESVTKGETAPQSGPRSLEKAHQGGSPGAGDIGRRGPPQGARQAISGNGEAPVLAAKAPRAPGQQPAVPVPKSGAEQALEKYLGPENAQHVVNAAVTLRSYFDDLQRLAAPASRGAEAEAAALTVQHRAAELARKTAIAEAALEKIRGFFGRMPLEERWAFYDRAERGQQQPTPVLDAIGQVFRNLLDAARKDVVDLGEGHLEAFIENYMPHMYKDPAKAREVFADYYAKRPLEGSREFLKARKYETLQDAMESGLVPVSENPVDMVLLKLREMQKFVMAHNVKQDLKEEGLLKYLSVFEKNIPAGYKKIDDHAFTVYGPPSVPVKEAYDKHVMDGLQKFADSIGIPQERRVNIGGKRWGYADPATGEVVTKFAGPESVLAHEIGHQLDWRYGLGKMRVKNPATKEELRRLADLRWEGEQPTKSFQKYVRKGEEKMAAMVEAFVHAPERFKQVAPNTWKIFNQVLDENPELQALRNIKPSLVLGTHDDRVGVGGMVTRGNYWAPEPVATIVNHYLSPGLREKSSLFRGFLGLGNVMNQFQLGYSAFHLGFTSMDSATSGLALGIYQAAHGYPLRGLTSAVRAPVELLGVPIGAAAKLAERAGIPGAVEKAAPFSSMLRGDAVLKEYYRPGSQPAQLATMVDAMVLAGGRAKMDSFYRTQVTQKMVDAFRAGKYFRGIWRVPFALTEQLARPIMDYVVPRQKLGVFSDLARFELERLGPDADMAEARGALSKAWASVDNRLGQLVYDNLHWNKFFKDALMASVRSVGWNTGTIRELLGGAADTRKLLSASKDSEGNWKLRPDVSTRLSYIVALPLMAALVGSLIQYLYTGEHPRDLKDMFFPRTGRKTADGHEERVATPSYVKDVVHYALEPVRTIQGKIHPLVSGILEMLTNRDFQHKPIVYDDDGILRAFEAEAEHVVRMFEPMSVKNAEQELKRGAGGAQAFGPSFFGISPAPSVIDKTPKPTKRPAGTIIRLHRTAPLSQHPHHAPHQSSR